MFTQHPSDDGVEPPVRRRHRRRRQRDEVAFGPGIPGSRRRYALHWAIRHTWIAWAGITSGVLMALMVPTTGARYLPLLAVIALTAGPIGAGVLALPVVALSRSWREHRDWRRLTELAQESGYRFHGLSDWEPPSELIGYRGLGGESERMLTGPGDRPVHIGQWSYLRDWGEGRVPLTSTVTWSYVAVPLRHPLPHILIDAHSNSSPLTFGPAIDVSRSQVLSLEGGFDKHFTVYCPSGYEADALYFLTPDVMADLVDADFPMDVEFNDSGIVLLSPGKLVAPSRERLTWLLQNADQWARRAERWSTWRDHRQPGGELTTTAEGGLLRPDSGVGEGGQRLRGKAWYAVGGWIGGALLGFAWLWAAIYPPQR